jgi:hypothetical protein
VPDFVSDTYTLSDGEMGAYWRLCMALWRFKGVLRLDHRQLAKIAGSTPKNWPKRWAAISRYFVIEGDRVGHSRITEDLAALGISAPSENAPGNPKEGHGRGTIGFPGESNSVDNPLENLGAASAGARSREPQLKPEPKLEAATPSATQPLRGLDDWPDVLSGRMVDVFAAAVGSPWLDPSKIVAPKFHAQAPGYLTRWRAAGCSWLADVLPVASAMAPTAGAPINSLKFFDGAILSAHAARTAPIDAASHHGGKRDRLTSTDENLRRSFAGSDRLAAYRRDHGWGGEGGD